MDKGQFKEFASAAKYYLDLVDEDNELPSTGVVVGREKCEY